MLEPAVGSRLTNFMGILSQGLRIAPPEAPATGYMFGKGVYFADMVTKSANYCHANKKDNVALMLLADVALGTPLLLKGAKYMDKAPGHYRPPAISDSGALCVPSRAQLQRPQV
eukprot:EG_transcript_39729